jgi:hypothetical protein
MSIDSEFTSPTLFAPGGLEVVAVSALLTLPLLSIKVNVSVMLDELPNRVHTEKLTDPSNPLPLKLSVTSITPEEPPAKANASRTTPFGVTSPS